jgi:hypothetical protein
MSTSPPTSQRTIDVFLDDLQPSGASDSGDPARAGRAQFSRDASLKSIDTRSTASSRVNHRTPQFGDRHQTPKFNKNLEMQTMRSNNTPMTEISLTDTPSGQSKLAQSAGGLSHASSFKELKKSFRRPYAKVNELGWRQSHWLRKWTIILSDSVVWEIAVLLLIVGNCITLAMASPLDDPSSAKSKVLSAIEWFFSVAFTIELLTKIIAMGYYTDENAYMRDNWNILDFIIVTFGWISEIAGGGGGLTAMRAMRVLRPLRTIKGIPELKRIIEGMISSIPQLSTVFGLCAGVYILFGILGMQLFSGKVRIGTNAPKHHSDDDQLATGNIPNALPHATPLRGPLRSLAADVAEVPGHKHARVGLGQRQVLLDVSVLRPPVPRRECVRGLRNFPERQHHQLRRHLQGLSHRLPVLHP